jgi:hypothetical protein
MIKDIEFKKTEDVAMAVIRKEDDEAGEKIWKVILLNLKSKPIESVIINSTGYGKKENRDVKTSELRQFFDSIQPKSFVEVEIITDELLGLHNQFWVSYVFENHLYDRRYVFLAESIQPEFFTDIPLINTRGILIK